MSKLCDVLKERRLFLFASEFADYAVTSFHRNACAQGSGQNVDLRISSFHLSPRCFCSGRPGGERVAFEASDKSGLITANKVPVCGLSQHVAACVKYTQLHYNPTEK